MLVKALSYLVEVYGTDCLAAGEEVDRELIAKFIEITVRSSTRERWDHVKQQQQSLLHSRLIAGFLLQPNSICFGMSYPRT